MGGGGGGGEEGAVVCNREGDDGHDHHYHDHDHHYHDRDHHYRGPAGPRYCSGSFTRICSSTSRFSSVMKVLGITPAMLRGKKTKQRKVKELARGCRAQKW